MRAHSFLSRVALVCNILFVYCWLIQKVTINPIHNKDVNAIILILGWFSAPLLNMAINIWWLLLLAQKKQPITPKWLLRTNLTLFIFEMVVLIVA